MNSESQYEVVISGIGAKLPKSKDVKEFGDQLFSKTNLLEEDWVRFVPATMDKPSLIGRIPDCDRFDYTFFGISSKLVDNCDPQMTHMLERSYEAIMDAGINPLTLKRHNVCVVAPSSMSDAEGIRITEVDFVQGYGMVGHSRTMLANRISYFLNLTGPSFSINNSWASAVQGIEIAAKLVGTGSCEAAIVTASNVIHFNSVEKEYADMNFLAPEGQCLPFDSNANGFVRSEATVTFFLQRAQDAKRHYCTILKSEVENLAAEPSPFIHINPKVNQFYRDFYSECKINPLDISYIEAFGCCNKDYDAKELNTISDIFCNGKSPTLVGSVFGNVGNTECPSGSVSLVKSIIALETGVIPPTIGYSTPNSNVPSLRSGQLKPVTEPTTLTGNMVAVNCLTFTGHVGHTLLKRHNKTKEILPLGELPPDGLPRLVILQTRLEEGSNDLIDKLANMPVDTEYISLINNIFNTPVPNYLWRSYITVPIVGDKKKQSEVQKCPATKQKLWFVFSGMGSQWPGMGRDLLQFPLFAASIDKCDKVLAPLGIDIRYILTTEDPETFDNILNCFVGIASIQVGLVDILSAMGVTPDGVIGHSVGELGCAYADGCLTAEEMVLSAYYRGKASLECLESDNIKGMMAAVGLGYNDIKDQVPSTIDVACHNSATSSTLSGPTKDVLKYVEELKSKNVFAKAVSAGGIAYHSRYIKDIGHKLLTYLKKVIQNPKPRSSRWISTSVPLAKWTTPEGRFCSAEYLTNNLLGSVLFHEGCQHLPNNIILLEIAPHGLLQAILRRSIGSDSISLAMTTRTSEYHNLHLLSTLGKLHNHGIELDINALYPPVQYPVSRGTPSLQEFAAWDHREKLFHTVQQICEMVMKTRGEEIFEINKKNSNYKLWMGHCINGSIVVPLSQLLFYSWHMVFKPNGWKIDQECITFEDVVLSDSLSVKESDFSLSMTFVPASLKFEVSKIPSPLFQQNIILSGKIIRVDMPQFSIPSLSKEEEKNEKVTETEIYSILAYYGCQLSDQFRLLKNIVVGKRACVAQVQWTGNWVTFLDALFKITTFIHSEKELTLMQPASFTKLTIKPSVFEKCGANSLVDVYYDTRSKRLVCEAVELCGITFSPSSGNIPPAICWKEVKVQAHENIKFSVEEFLSTSIQLASQVSLSPWARKSSVLKIIIMKDENGTSVLFINILQEVIKSLSNLSVEIQELDLKNTLEYLNQIKYEGCLLVGQYHKTISVLETTNHSNIYCLTYNMNNDSPVQSTSIRCIMSYQSKGGRLSLLKRRCISLPIKNEKIFGVKSRACLDTLTEKLAQDKSSDHVIVVSSTMTPRDLLPVLANKPFAHRLCTVFILDKNAPEFSINSPIYNNEISVGLPVNILSKGEWGTLITSNIDAWPQNKNINRLFHSSDKTMKVICTGLNVNSFNLNQEFDINKMELNCADFSGYMGKERVMGVAKCDSLFSLTPDPVLRWPVPSGWTLEDAATVPAIYTLAYYCVLVKGCVKAGEDVLVNAGMSPIGQAVIGITLQIGANVIATVTSQEEADALLNLYPSLKPKNIILLGKMDIFVAITKLTAAKGVQVVVNCMRGNEMKSCIQAMGNNCRFLHLGQIKIEDKESIGMLVFVKCTSFYGISLEIITTCSHATKVILREAVQKGLNEGVIKPLRKATFSSIDEEHALMHLRDKSMYEKTVLINDIENRLYPKRIEDYCCTSDQSVVILGAKSDFWMDVAEWLVLRGAKKLVVFMEEEDDILNKHSSRFNRLMSRFKTSFCMLSKSRLLSQENAFQVLEEILRIGEITHIFCIEQDENSIAMRNLDLASRELVPHLRQFVSLLGKGAAVSESREESSLPVCSVQCSLPLQNPAHVLPYLSTLPANFSSNSRFFLVNDKVKSFEAQDYTDINTFLPATLTELYQIGDKVSEVPVFSEEATLTLRYRYNYHSLLPVFIISGLGSQSMHPLLRQLMHPAFCCTVPAFITSVNEYAELLLQALLKIKKQGSFNIIGSTWGGPVALALANLLGARGHHVQLFLLEGAPIHLQNRIRGLCEKYNSTLGPSLLAETFNLSSEVLKQVSHSKSWEDQLSEAIQQSKVAADVRQSTTRALTCLFSQLNSLMHQETPQKIHGDLTLITYRPVSKSDKENLAQLTEKENTKIVTIEEESYFDFLSNPKTAAEINDNLAFEWKM